MSYRSSVCKQWGGIALGLGMVLLSACGTWRRHGAPELLETPIKSVRAPDAASNQMYDILLGEIAGQRGQVNDAVQRYLDAAQSSDDPRIAQRAMQIALYAHDEKRAQQAAERWLQLQPNSLEPRQALSMLYLRAGRIDDSIAQFDRLVTAVPKASVGPLYIQIALLLSREPDKAAALKVMRGLVAKHEHEPYAQLSLSQLAAITQDWPVAEHAVARALQLKPDWVDALVLRARIQAERGQTEAALAGMRHALVAHPNNTELRLNYARLLVQLKRPKEARAQFQQLAHQVPNDADVQFALGLLALDAGQTVEATAYFKRLLKLGKHQDEARYYLGRIAEDKRLYPEALDWYGQVEQGEHQLEAELRIAALLAKRGDIDAALGRLHALQALNPAMATRITLAEGEVLVSAQRQTQAMALYDQALQHDPDNNDLLYARALLAEKMNHLDILERDLRAILKRDPNNALALNALGYTLADRTTRFDEAEQLIKRALAQLSNDPAVLDSMGWVEFRLGRTADALKYLRQAYSVNNDAEIAAHLVEVLSASGDRAGAREIGNKALKLDPDNAALKGVMQRLKL
ncbi:MAG: tetratricopeptide repeat protein [Gammaproteobacteria bacterium]